MEHILLYIAALLILLLLAAAVVTGFMLRRRRGTAGEFDYLVVLGTTVNGTSPSIMLADRIRAAGNYLNTHPDVTCIVSGGKGSEKDISEAACMARELIAMGIDPERIWQEDQSETTVENLRFSMDLIEERVGVRPGRIGLLSSDFHIFRVQLVAKKLGIPTTTVYADSTFTIFFCTAFLREILALWYYCLFVL